MEMAIAAIHQSNESRQAFDLCYGCHDRNAGLYVRYPLDLKTAVEMQLATHYPDMKLQRLSDDALAPPPGFSAWSASVDLRPCLFPLKRHADFEDRLKRNTSDPLAGLLAAIAAGNRDRMRCLIELRLKPTSRWRRWKALRIAARVNNWPFFRSHRFLAAMYVNQSMSPWFPRLRSWPMLLLARFWGNGDGQREPDDKLGRHLYDARLRLMVFAPPGAEPKVRCKMREMAGAFGQFAAPGSARFRLVSFRRGLHSRVGRSTFLLSDEEVATLWHPPGETVRAPTMATNDSRELEAPATVFASRKKGEEMAILGRVNFRSNHRVFGIGKDDRRRHLALVGKTGMGKSTLLERLIGDDISAGRGVGLVDPHGDLAEAVLRMVPKSRTNDVVLFDAGDREYSPSYNPLACDDPGQRPLVASAVVSAFKKIYGDSWGPRLEHILRNSVLAMLEVPETTLLSLLRMLSDAAYREHILSQVEDPLVRSFWRIEFERWPVRLQMEAVAPISNKVGQFLSSPLLRSIVGQSHSRIDLRQIMDNSRILIANLSKGRIGEDASTLLGSLLVTGIQQAAMSRAELPEQDRNDCYLYVDEFQNFATESFATILSEARKYRLNLTIANQYLAQLDDAIASAVFGNIGSLVTFQVGSTDAEILAGQFAGDVTPADVIALPKYHAYVRLLVDGEPTRPFSMKTLPPRRVRGPDRLPTIRNASRRRYARPASQVASQLQRQMAS